MPPENWPAPSLRQSLIWLFPLIFVIHDGEEVITMKAWVSQHRELLRNISDVSPLLDRIVANIPTTTRVMAGAVGFESVIILLASIALARWLRAPSTSRIALYIYSGLLAAYLVHVVTHIAHSVVFAMYTPGVITAILVVPPVGGYLYAKVLKGTPLRGRVAVISAAAGVVSIMPIVTTAHLIGRWIFG